MGNLERVVKMIIPKANRKAIYEALFKDGVMVAIKDGNKPQHNELEKVRNLEVMCAMKSLKSRGYVRENFAWRHHYWYLTNEGIQYLRDYLHLPPEIVPATLKKTASKSDAPKPWAKGDQRSSGPRGDATVTHTDVTIKLVLDQTSTQISVVDTVELVVGEA